MARQENTLTFTDARLIFKNFKGEETPYNRAGDRNFCVVIEDEGVARQLLADGWNVKTLAPREEGDVERYYIKVKISFRGRPPKIVMVTSRGKTEIPEELVDMLAYADMRTVDLIVRPYNWDVRGEKGVSGYLKTMYVTINEDELEVKYADVEDAI